MARPWDIIARADTDEGCLELRRRADDDILLTIAGRVLMSSRAHRSEVALAELACAAVAERSAPRILIGGLGMGYTLRAALDSLAADARVVIVEITPAVVAWCRKELAHLNRDALADPRVELRIEDVARTVATAATPGGAYDAILLDLYVGPNADTHSRDDPFYGERMLAQVRAALRPGGVFAVWSEGPCAAFENRLRRCGFSVTLSRPGKGGLRHAVYVARLSAR